MGFDQALKVVHLISGDLWAGAEVQAFTLLRQLQEIENLHVSVVVLNNGKLAEKLTESGIEITVIDETRYGFAKIQDKLKELLIDKEIDILHSHRYKENILAARVKKACGIKHLVQTVHGTQENFKGIQNAKIKVYGAINRYYSRNYFDKIIAVSEDIHQDLSAVYDSDQLVTIHNAVAMTDIKPVKTSHEIRHELNLEENQPVIGTAGRMVPIKGYDLLLKAAVKILDKNPRVGFLIAGDGPLLDELKQQAKDLGIDGSVQFLGFRNDITDILNCLDIFVMSSQYEGIPMVLLEAMTLSKPVVSTTVGGIREVITDNISGRLVEPESVEALTDGCLEILQGPDLRMKLAEGARKRIKEEFSSERLTDRMVKLYQSLVSQDSQE